MTPDGLLLLTGHLIRLRHQDQWVDSHREHGPCGPYVLRPCKGYLSQDVQSHRRYLRVFSANDRHQW